ncbi:hypothetical protein ACCAA_200027 [Candidatus Accumulibacter aalborgensis]|uniref:Uncharacterized protein n=1 Tax=Candidatus Accumulibacter aalborgensis TaxID=1860102 RepID=A0A1A8XJB8_9PROT|nr:hypothetical protein ACCAA_200027 [Candidatus Accumulibacter aalborgensis]
MILRCWGCSLWWCDKSVTYYASIPHRECYYLFIPPKIDLKERTCQQLSRNQASSAKRQGSRSDCQWTPRASRQGCKPRP